MRLAETLTPSLFGKNELEGVNAPNVKEGKLREKKDFSQFSLCQVALAPTKEAKANLKGCIIL